MVSSPHFPCVGTRRAEYLWVWSNLMNVDKQRQNWDMHEVLPCLGLPLHLRRPYFLPCGVSRQCHCAPHCSVVVANITLLVSGTVFWSLRVEYTRLNVCDQRDIVCVLRRLSNPTLNDLTNYRTRKGLTPSTLLGVSHAGFSLSMGARGERATRKRKKTW